MKTGYDFVLVRPDEVFREKLDEAYSGGLINIKIDDKTWKRVTVYEVLEINEDGNGSINVNKIGDIFKNIIIYYKYLFKVKKNDFISSKLFIMPPGVL